MRSGQALLQHRDGDGENAANAASPGPARKLCRHEGPQTAANRTSGSNPAQFFCDIKNLLAEGRKPESNLPSLKIKHLSSHCCNKHHRGVRYKSVVVVTRITGQRRARLAVSERRTSSVVSPVVRNRKSVVTDGTSRSERRRQRPAFGGHTEAGLVSKHDQEDHPTNDGPGDQGRPEADVIARPAHEQRAQRRGSAHDQAA